MQSTDSIKSSLPSAPLPPPPYCPSYRSHFSGLPLVVLDQTSTSAPLLTPDDFPHTSLFLAPSLLRLSTPSETPMPSHEQRPKAQPVQDVFDLSDEDSSYPSACSSCSSSEDMTFSSMEAMRCSRCHNSSINPLADLAKGNMVSFGTNLYYCRRCATFVGYRR